MTRNTTRGNTTCNKTTRNKRIALIAAPIVAIGTAAAVAQTVVPEAPTTPAVERGASEFDAKPTAFRGGRRGGGMRGAMLGQFQEADADGNGALTQTEVDQYLASQLTETDADGDGSVSLDEFQTFYAEQTRPRMVDAFQRLDADGDGAVTSAELTDQFGSIVERMDRNGDDALSADDRRGRGDRGRGRGGDRR